MQPSSGHDEEADKYPQMSYENFKTDLKTTLLIYMKLKRLWKNIPATLSFSIQDKAQQ